MPKNRPGRMHQPVTATKTITHGLPASESGLVGIAVKQKSPTWDAAFSTLKTIASGEQFALIAKGIVETATFTGSTKGANVYITPSTGALSVDNTLGNLKFGKVVEVVGDGRGVPTGKVRIDLDAKDQVPPVATS